MEELVTRLSEFGALSLLSYVEPPAVILVACDALVAEIDTPSVRALAGLASNVPATELRLVLTAALGSLGVTLGSPDDDAVRLLATAAVCRAYLRGEIEGAALAEWTHDVIGHSGPASAQDLVEIADDLVVEEYIPALAQVLIDTRVRAFLAE